MFLIIVIVVQNLIIMIFFYLDIICLWKFDKFIKFLCLVSCKNVFLNSKWGFEFSKCNCKDIFLCFGIVSAYKNEKTLRLFIFSSVCSLRKLMANLLKISKHCTCTSVLPWSLEKHFLCFSFSFQCWLFIYSNIADLLVQYG
jgi:hypothetical protein